jgi:UDP-3-O-[3-hydroxymyristoyl] glucosamine N-acyltransferase
VGNVRLDGTGLQMAGASVRAGAASLGRVAAESLVVSGTANAAACNIAGRLEVGGDLQVFGSMTFAGVSLNNLRVGDTLNVGGSMSSNSATVADLLKVGGKLDAGRVVTSDLQASSISGVNQFTGTAINVGSVTASSIGVERLTVANQASFTSMVRAPAFVAAASVAAPVVEAGVSLRAVGNLAVGDSATIANNLLAARLTATDQLVAGRILAQTVSMSGLLTGAAANLGSLFVSNGATFDGSVSFRRPLAVSSVAADGACQLGGVLLAGNAISVSNLTTDELFVTGFTRLRRANVTGNLRASRVICYGQVTAMSGVLTPGADLGDSSVFRGPVKCQGSFEAGMVSFSNATIQALKVVGPVELSDSLRVPNALLVGDGVKLFANGDASFAGDARTTGLWSAARATVTGELATGSVRIGTGDVVASGGSFVAPVGDVRAPVGVVAARTLQASGGLVAQTVRTGGLLVDGSAVINGNASMSFLAVQRGVTAQRVEAETASFSSGMRASVVDVDTGLTCQSVVASRRLTANELVSTGASWLGSANIGDARVTRDLLVGGNLVASYIQADTLVANNMSYFNKVLSTVNVQNMRLSVLEVDGNFGYPPYTTRSPGGHAGYLAYNMTGQDGKMVFVNDRPLYWAGGWEWLSYSSTFLRRAASMDPSGNLTTLQYFVHSRLGLPVVDAMCNMYPEHVFANTVTSNNLAVLSNLTVNGCLRVLKDSEFVGEGVVRGNVRVDRALSVGRRALFDDDVGVAGRLAVEGRLFANANARITSLLEVMGDGVVTRDVRIDRDTSMGRDLQVSGNTSLVSELGVGGRTFLGGKLTANGNVELRSFLLVDGDARVTRDVRVDRDTSMGRDLQVSGNTSLVSELSVGGRTFLGGKLTANGNVELRSFLLVDGDARVTRDMRVDRDTSMGRDLQVGGNTSLASELYVQGRSLFESNVDLRSLLTVNGKVTANGNVELRSFLLVDGDARVTQDVRIDRDTSMGRDLQVSGNTSLASELSVGGRSFLGGKLTANGNVELRSFLLVDGDANVTRDVRIDRDTSMGRDLQVWGNTSLASELSVAGRSFLGGKLTANGNVELRSFLLVDGDARVTRDARIDRDTSIGRDLQVSGNTSLSSELRVGGRSYLGGKLTANGDVELRSLLTVDGNVVVTKNIVVAGNSLLQGTLDVNGAARFAADTWVDGHLTIKGNAQVQTCLEVLQGADVRRDLRVFGDGWVGGSARVSGKTYADAGANVQDLLEVAGNVQISRNLTVGGNANLDGLLQVSGQLSALQGLQVLGPASFGSMATAAAGMDVRSVLQVRAPATIEGALSARTAVDIRGALTVGSASVFEGNVKTLGNLVFYDNSSIRDVTSLFLRARATLSGGPGISYAPVTGVIDVLPGIGGTGITYLSQLGKLSLRDISGTGTFYNTSMGSLNIQTQLFASGLVWNSATQAAGLTNLAGLGLKWDSSGAIPKASVDGDAIFSVKSGLIWSGGQAGLTNLAGLHMKWNTTGASPKLDVGLTFGSGLVLGPSSRVGLTSLAGWGLRWDAGEQPTLNLDLTRSSALGIGLGTTAASYALDVSGTVRASGDVIAFSDKRSKQDIRVIDGPLPRVRALTGYTFRVGSSARRSTGLLAQDILPVLPEAVYEDDSGLLSVAYGNMAGLLVEAIKALEERVAALEARVQLP